MEESKSKLKAKSTNKRTQKKLPWWIELLFVQIGLPEKFLTKFLSLEKETKIILKSQRGKYKFYLLIGITILYLYPIIKESRLRNECIEITYKEIIDNEEISSSKAKAVNYCNGGNLDL